MEASSINQLTPHNCLIQFLKLLTEKLLLDKIFAIEQSFYFFDKDLSDKVYDSECPSKTMNMQQWKGGLWKQAMF